MKPSTSVHPGWRIGIAVLLPLLCLGGFEAYARVNAAGRQLEMQSRARAETVMALVDAHVQTEVKLARAYASSTALQAGDLQQAYTRAKEYQATAGDWMAVRVLDDDHGAELFDTRRPLGPERAPEDRLAQSQGKTIQGVTVGDLARDHTGRPTIPVVTHVRAPHGVRETLVVELDPAAIHNSPIRTIPISWCRAWSIGMASSFPGP